MNLCLKLYTPAEIEKIIAIKVKKARLNLKLKRSTLSNRSGVSISSIKRFETIGKISFSNLLKIANALNYLDEFLLLFPEKEAKTLAELEATEKKNQIKRVRGSI